MNNIEIQIRFEKELNSLEMSIYTLMQYAKQTQDYNSFLESCKTVTLINQVKDQYQYLIDRLKADDYGE